jgi:DNA-binding response OmpR family regulator
MALAVETVSNQPTHVLLIEDSPGDAAWIRMRLLEGNSELEVSCADRLSTGLAALAVKPPAVVLLDLNLPDSHGAQTFRNVLNQAPRVPVVVLSGMEDEELAVQAVHEGVQDYLVKGAFDSKQLTRALRYAIERQAPLPRARHEPDATRRSTSGGNGTLDNSSGSEQSRCVEGSATSRNRASHRLSKAETYQVLFPGRKSSDQSIESIGGHCDVMQGRQKFDLWKEYFSDLLRETAQAYAQGATQEEAEKRVEQWLVTKYADKFYPRSSQNPNAVTATYQKGPQ